jgi:hypothetical protein
MRTLLADAAHAFSMRLIRTGSVQRPTVPTCPLLPRRIQYEGNLHREGLVMEGMSIKERTRRTGFNESLVRRILRGPRIGVFSS